MSKRLNRMPTAPWGAAPVPGVLLAITVAAGILWNGAFDLEARILMHVLLVAACGILLLAPADRLARMGWAAWLALPPTVALLAGAVASVGALEPDRSAVSLGVPILVLGALTVLGGVVLPGGRPRSSPPWIVRVAAIGLLVVAVLSIAHVGLRPSALYGVWPVRAERPFAPLVNGNFDAFLTVLALPVVGLELVRRPRPERPWTWVLAASVLGGLGVILLSGARGAIVGLIVVLMVAAGRAILPRSRWVAPGLSVLGAGVALLVAVTIGPTVFETQAERSLALRIESWQGALTLLAEHPLLGIGPGNLLPALQPHQPVFPFVRLDHLHMDPLETVLQLGLPGTIALVAALAVVPRGPLKDPLHRSSGLLLGLCAALVHSVFDFPLHLPALLVLVALVWGWRRVRWTSDRPIRPLLARGLLLGVVLLQLAAIATLGHARIVQSALPGVRAIPPADGAADFVEALAPWRPEPPLARARQAVLDTDRALARTHALAAVARAPHDANLLLDAGAVLVATGHHDEAADLLDRAMSRHAADHRSRALASRLAARRDQPDQAQELFVEAVRRWPEDRLIGDDVFARGLSLQPLSLWWIDRLEPLGRPMPLYALGVELLEQGDAPSALIALERAAFVDPRFGTNPMLGVALVEAGQLEAGLAQLERADAQDRTGRASRLAAEILLERDRPADALPHARHAFAENRHDARNADVLIRSTHRAEGAEAALALMPSLARRGDAPSLDVAVSFARAALELNAISRCLDLLGERDDRNDVANALLRECTSKSGL